MDGVPSSVATASFQTRIIVRDVTGKYTWDCAVLYGPEPPPSASGKYHLFIAYEHSYFHSTFSKLVIVWPTWR